MSEPGKAARRENDNGQAGFLAQRYDPTHTARLRTEARNVALNKLEGNNPVDEVLRGQAKAKFDQWRSVQQPGELKSRRERLIVPTWDDVHRIAFMTSGGARKTISEAENAPDADTVLSPGKSGWEKDAFDCSSRIASTAGLAVETPSVFRQRSDGWVNELPHAPQGGNRPKPRAR